MVGQTGSNNFDVSGNHQESQYSDAEDIWVFKIGQDHEIIYQKCFGSYFDEDIYDGAAAFDGINKITIAAKFYYNNGDIDCDHQPIIGGELNYGIWAISVLDTTVNNTAIEEFEYGFEIYPNPSNHQLTIKLPENTKFKSVPNTSENNILLYNSLGELAGEFPIKDQITINTTGYPSGLYFLQCAIGDALITDKVMILHE